MNRAATIRSNRAAHRRGLVLDYAVGAAAVVWAYQAIMGVVG